MPPERRRLAAIMFTDLVDFSALARADEGAALEVLERHNRLLRPIFAEFAGREIKTVGDAFLVEFASAVDATRCALEIQRRLSAESSALAGTVRWEVRVRIGIHVGDVVETDDDVLGDAVNVASRIQALAPPGGICLTQQVVDQVEHRLPLVLTRLPPSALKNIRDPPPLYAVGPAGPAVAVARVGGPAASGRLLAVLPLANFTADPHEDYFADGLTEELISVLSKVPGLRLIAHTSVSPYRSAPKSAAQIGAELGVGVLLEGSIRKTTDRLRVTLRLVDVATQTPIWSNSYDRELGDVFAVQTDVANRTARALRPHLAVGDRTPVAPRVPADLAAYDAYLRGLVAASNLAAGTLDEAIRCFTEATRRDPTFADAFAALADLYVAAAGDFLPMREVLPRARELARQALALDPDCSEAHSALANIALQCATDWAVAEREFRTALDLNPSNVHAHRYFALLLYALGRFDEAKEELREAIRLDPGGANRGTLIWTELDAGQVELALRMAEEDRDRDPGSATARTYLGFHYLRAGRRADAEREAATPLEGASDPERFDRAMLEALVGRPDAARAIVDEVARGEARSYTSLADLAMLHSALGDRERALDLLERDFREGDRVLWLYFRGVFFDAIRDDPRFVALLRAYGLPLASPAAARPRATDLAGVSG